MMQVRVFIADDQFLVTEGLKTLVSEYPGFELAGHISECENFAECVIAAQPDVLLVDFTSSACSIKEILRLLPFIPKTRLLAITSHQSASVVKSALDAGISGYVLKDCSREEITEAILATAGGEKFFCGKVLDTLMSEDKDLKTSSSTAACEALNISDRELEIIKLIAEGNSNKQIAEQLFISQHTVNTHRKNIMSKLGVNNTAGIVLFAVREHLVSPNKYLFSANT